MCQVTSSKHEDLIFFLHFYLQILNDIDVKNSLGSLKCKYYLKQVTRTRKQMLEINEN